MNIPGENAGPRYHQLVDPLTADKRNRIIPAYGVRRKVILLDNAFNAQPLGLKGDFWYCDFNSTGVGLVQLNNVSEDPIPAVALAGLGNLPYDEMFITSAAQPGKVLNLWYGYGAEFISPTSAIATIGSILNPVTVTVPALDGQNHKYSPGFTFGQLVAAVAAQSGFLKLLNPVASGIRVFIDKMHFGPAATGGFDIRSGVAGGALVGGGIKKDSTTPVASLAQIYFGNSAAVGGVVWDHYLTLASTDKEKKFDEPVILQPGESLTMADLTVNDACRLGFEWREGV